jgi:hypothetical protein
MEPQTLWERIKQGLRESASTAAEKAEYLGKLGRARLDIAETRHAIHEALAELGGAVYEHLGKEGEGMAGTLGVEGLVAKIRDLEGQLKAREDSLDAVRASGEAQEGPAEETEV